MTAFGRPGEAAPLGAGGLGTAGRPPAVPVLELPNNWRRRSGVRPDGKIQTPNAGAPFKSRRMRLILFLIDFLSFFWRIR